MSRNLLVAVVSGALALPMAAQVSADAQVYGSLRYGVEMVDASDAFVPNSEEDTMWNLGSNRSSRWGIKGSMEAGDGLTAGFKMERAIGGTGSPSGMTARHHHVYLSGDFGTATFGQQDAPYYGATTWDGSQTLGGATDFLYRSSGISYASNLGGPFSFKVLFGARKGGAEGSEDGLDHVEASANFAAGPVNMSLGVYNDADKTVGGVKIDGMQRVGGTVGGNAGPINWEIGFDSGENSMSKVADGKWLGGKVRSGYDEDGDVTHDDDRYGVHLGYAVSEAGNLYMQYSGQKYSVDDSNDEANRNSWLIGYSHVLAAGVVVYGEYSNTSVDAEVDGMTVVDVGTNKAVVALKVGF